MKRIFTLFIPLFLISWISYAQPATQVSNILISPVSANSLHFDWTAGNAGNKVLVIIRNDISDYIPANGVDPVAAGTAFPTDGGGADLDNTGTGQIAAAVWAATGTSIPVVTGLIENKQYIIEIYEYTGSGATVAYNRTSQTRNPISFNYFSSPSTLWTTPAQISTVTAQVWGAGGGSGGVVGGSNRSVNGGGGGAFAGGPVSVLSGNSYTVTVGAGGASSVSNTAGGDGGPSSITAITTVAANGGVGATANAAGGAGGAVGTTGTAKFAGGPGGARMTGGGGGGGGGGGSAGSGGVGGTGGTSTSATGGTAGVAGIAGASGLGAGAAGGAGGNNGAAGGNGNFPGGGGGGGGNAGSAGSGASGFVILSFIDVTAPTVTSIVRQNPTSASTNATTVNFRVTFNENVTNVDAGDFTLGLTGTAAGTIGTVAPVSSSQSQYDVQITGVSGTGTIDLNFAGGQNIIDLSNNAFGGTSAGDEIYTLDTTRPTVSSIVRADTDPTNAASVNYTVTFSEHVNGLATNDFALTLTGSAAGTISNVSAAAGTTVTVTINSMTGDGTIRLDVPNTATITDDATNTLNTAFTTGEVYTVDRIIPTVSSIVKADSDPTNAASVNYTVTFSEHVNSLATNDFALSLTGSAAGTISNVSAAAGTTVTVTVNAITGTGTIRLDVPNTATITDDVGNGLTTPFTTGEVYTVDRTLPTVSSIVRADGNPTNATSVNYTVTFSEHVNGLATNDFALTLGGTAAGTISNVSAASGTSVTVTVNTITGEGTIRLDVPNTATITDDIGNALTAAFITGEVYNIDLTAPTVSSITRVSATPSNAASLTYTVTFSENVTGLATNDFSLTTGGTATGTISNVSAATGTSVTVTINSITGTGTLRLDVPNTATITDDAGNALTTTFTTGEVYDIDHTLPTVSSIVRADTDPSNAASVHYTVTFSEHVNGLATNDFSLTLTGSAAGTISNVSAAAGTTVTVTVNAITGTGTLRLNVPNTATITDDATNALTAAFTTGEVYTIDRTPPTVSSIVRANGNPTNAASVDYTVTFSENVNGLAANDFSLTLTGSATGTISSVSAATGTIVTVTVNSITGEGTIRLNVPNTATITDDIGNALTAAFTTGEVYTFDHVAPTVSSIVRVSATPTNATSLTYTVSFSENVSGLATNDFTLTTGGTAAGTISNVSAASGNSVTVTVNTITGTGTLRLDVPNTATINDDAGNPLTAAFTTGQVYDIDHTLPTVSSIVRADADPTNATSVNYTVTFSEHVNGLATNDFTLTLGGTAAGTISNVSAAAGTTVTVTVNSITGSGTIRLDVPNTATITDDANNGLNTAFTTGEFYTIDNSPPTAAITLRNASPINATSVTFRVTFNKNVNNVDISDFVLNPANTALGTLPGAVTVITANRVFDITVTSVSGDSEILNLDFAAGQDIVDGLSNPFSGTPSADPDFIIDTIAPTISPNVLNLSLNGGSPETIVFTLSEELSIGNGPVTGFTTSTGAIASAVYSGAGTTNTITITSTLNLGFNASTTVSYSGGNITDKLVLNPMATITTQPVILLVINLGLGDIAFTSFESDDPDYFSFVLLKDISAGTIINFTDNGWTNTNSFRSDGNDGTISWKADVDYFAGTEIVFTGNAPFVPNFGTVTQDATNDPLKLFTSGDQIFAYQGTSSSPTFLAAINFNSATWDSNSTDQNTSALPSTISAGNYVTMASVDNGKHNRVTTSGSVTALRSNINNSSNWTSSNSSITAPTGGLTSYVLPPDLTGTPFSPATGSVVPATLPTLTISYNDNIIAGSSTGADIQLFDASAGSNVTTWNVGTPSVTISGSTVTINPGAIGLINGHIYRVFVAKRIFLNSDGNGNTPITGSTWQFTADAVPPTVSSINRLTPSTTPTNVTSVTFRVTFSEAVTGVSATDFTKTQSGITSGALSVNPQSSSVYDVTVPSISGNGTLRLDVLNGTATITDNPGNAFVTSYTSGQSYTIDQTAPTVTSITPNSANPTNATSVAYTVNFSENVNGLSTGDFALTTSGATGTIASVSAASGSSVTVTINSISGDGTIRLDVPNTATITDDATNSFTAAYTSAPVYNIDNTAPVVNSIVPISGTPTNSPSVAFLVSFSETVNNIDIGDFSLTKTGTVAATIASVNVSSGTSAVVIVNTISGDGTLRLDVKTSAGGATLADNATNALTGGFTTGGAYTIDNTPPSIVDIINNPAILNAWSPSYFITTPAYHGDKVDFTVIFSEPVSNLGDPEINDHFNTFPVTNFPAVTAALPPSITPVDVSGNPASAPSKYWKIVYSSVSGTGFIYSSYENVNFNVKDAAGNVESHLPNPPEFFGYEDGVYNYFYYVTFPQPTFEVNDASFTSTGVTTTSITLQWDHSGGAQLATDYIIRAKETSIAGFPPSVTIADGQIPADDTDASDGILVKSFDSNAWPSGPANQSYAFTGLKSGVSYDFEIYPYTLSDNVGYVESIDYNTTNFATYTTSTTTASQGTLALNAGGSTLLSTVNSNPGQQVMQFTIKDDGSVPASDNSPLTFSSITITPGAANNITRWDEVIPLNGATLFDGTTTIIGDVDQINGNKITFTIPLANRTNPGDFGFIDDDLSRTYTLKIWLKNDLSGSQNYPANIDGLKFDFKVDGVSSLAYDDVSNNNRKSSKLLTTGVGSSVQSGANTVDVKASQLAFRGPGPLASAPDYNPADGIGVGSLFPVAPLVYALDANNNHDKGYTVTSNVTSTNAAVVRVAPHTNFVGGILTLNDIYFTSPGTTTIKVTDPSVTTPASPATSISIVVSISGKTIITDGPTASTAELASFSSLTTALTGATAPELNATQYNFDFTITDDVGVTAKTDDALPTMLNKIIINRDLINDGIGDWSLAIAGAQLKDNAIPFSNVAPVNIINQNDLTFNVNSSTLGYIGDGSSKTYTLTIWLKQLIDPTNPVNSTLRNSIDNQSFVFTVSENEVTPDGGAASSTMTAGAATSGNGRNKVIVDAKTLLFTTQPDANQNYDASMTPVIIAKPVDVNSNVDKDYAGTATVGTLDNVTYPLANTTVTNNFIAGSRYFSFDSNLKVTSAGNGADNASTRLVLSGPGLTNGQSNFFTLHYSTNSDIVKDPGFVHNGTAGNKYTTDIPYINYQNATFTSNADGVALERFLIQDGGASHIDADGSPTKLQTIKLNVSNWQFVRTLALYDGSTKIGEQAVTSGVVNFTSLAPFQADANQSKALTVYATFNNVNIFDATNFDNQTINVSVADVTSAVVSSSFSSSGKTTTYATLTAPDNQLEVVASIIDFTTVPAFASINISFTVVAEARDAKGNRDFDYNGAISFIDTNGNTSNFTVSNPPSGAFNSGLLNYPAGFQFTSGNSATKLSLKGAPNAQTAADITGYSTDINVISSFDSWLYFDSDFTYTAKIPFASHQETTLTSSSQALGRFILSDGGAPGSAVNPLPGTRNLGPGAHDDSDGAPTTISSIKVSLTHSNYIRAISIFDHSGNRITTEQPGAAIVSFNGLNIPALTAADNDTVKFYIRASFIDQPVIDKDQITMQITDVTWSAGSQFPPGSVGGLSAGDVSSTTENKMDVIATSLDFAPQAPRYAGINEPLGSALPPLPATIADVVYAHDKYQNLDTDFNYTPTQIIGAGAVSGASFQNGVLDLTGMEYTNVGDGTLTIIANGLNSSNPPCTPGVGGCTSVVGNLVNVVNVTATYPSTGVLVGDGTPPTFSIKGGSLDQPIFGVTFTASGATASEPSLKKFSILFDNSFHAINGGVITDIFTNFRILRGSTNITPSVTLTYSLSSTSTDDPGSQDIITVDLGASPQALFNGPVTYYLVADVDPTANITTPSLTPQIIDGGYGFTTDANIVVTAGTASGNFAGNKYTFASTKPPVLKTAKGTPANPSSIPYAGQLNVDADLTQIKLQFDVAVTSLDGGGAELYNRTTNAKVADLVAVPGAGNYLSTGDYLNVVNPLIFNINFVSGASFQADEVYYVTVKKGSFDPIALTGTGISDQGLNFFGGISSNAILYFKIASDKPLKLKTVESTFNNQDIGTITTNFDQFGTAYYLAVPTTSPAPTNAQVKTPSTYLSAKAAFGNYTIDRINALQTASFTANYVLGQTYNIYIYAENDAPTPVPSGKSSPNPAGGIYGTDKIAGSVGPTLQITASSANNTSPDYLICPNSFVTLSEPIVIGESTVGQFKSASVQNFNILLPTGYEFDILSSPSIQLIGSDFGTNVATTNFVSNTVLNISYTNNPAIAITTDYILISNLRIKGATGSTTQNILRFYGSNTFIQPSSTIATIGLVPTTQFKFTNSYSVTNSPFPILSPTSIVTAIPDNYVDNDASIAGSVRLNPLIDVTNDYNASTFSGTGVTNDLLTLSAVPNNTAFNITMMHVDPNGCVSQKSEQYLVYDHRNSISKKLGTAYPSTVNEGTAQALVNVNFPTGDSPDITSPIIAFNELAGYRLMDLSADLPASEIRLNDVDDNQRSQIISGDEWRAIVQKITLPPPPAFKHDLGTLGTYYDYNWNYGYILNAVTESANAIKVNPYDGEKDTDPNSITGFRFRKSSGKSNYWTGGSLGKVEFTGVYRSSADLTVVVPFRQQVELFVPPVPLIEVSMPSDTLGNVLIYCEQGGPISITGYPSALSGTSTGVFKLTSTDGSPIAAYNNAAFIDNGNGTATIYPFLNGGGGITNGYNDIKISYTYKDNNSPASGTATYLIRVTPNPVAAFIAASDFTKNTPLANSYCEGKSIAFDASTSSIANGTLITKYSWNFNDGNATGSTGDNPNNALVKISSHYYSQTGKYNPSLIVTSEFNCASPAQSKELAVGVIPKVGFSLTGVSTADDITFLNTTGINPGVVDDGLDKLNWSFGNSKNLLVTTGYNDAVTNNYDDAGQYVVNLKVTSKKGCVDTLAQKIVVLPKSIPDGTKAYNETFEGNNGGDWQVWNTGNATNGMDKTPISWAYGTPSTEVIKIDAALNGSTIWKTNLSGKYNGNERSALYSPSFDLSQLERPMISFNSFVQMESSDGVVLQYSIDNKNITDVTKEWFALGDIGDGVDWFTSQGIAAKPGDQTTRDLAWSNADVTKWLTSKHSLAPVQDAKQVVFRFALGSRKEVIGFEGFAVDNVRIGERTRTVLFESFANTSNTNPQEKIQNTAIAETQSVGTEVVKVNYHVGFPGEDPFNGINAADPSARALYYNVKSTPATRIDGTKDEQDRPFNEWGNSSFEVRSLQLSQADLNILHEVKEDGTISIRLDIKAVVDLPENTILHIGILEESISSTVVNSPFIKSGETNFEYVLKKMLPSAAGTRFGKILTGGSTQPFGPFEWTPNSQELYPDKDDLVIIVFLQNELTKEVYQSEIVRGIQDPPTITGLGEIAGEDIIVYPNPADREFTIQLPGAIQKGVVIQLMDQVGQFVRKDKFESGDQKKTISTESLAEGLYIIQLGEGKTAIHKKVIITHK